MSASPEFVTVGVISDTHGLLRPEAVAALAGCDLIIHAGDICGAEILDELGRLAPVHAVRGNMDGGAWCEGIPWTDVVEVAGHQIYVLHILDELDLDPAAAGFAAVVYGHTHEPVVEERDGVLFVNPGSAGPRRFELPVSVARIRVGEAGVSAELVGLELG